MSKETLIGMLKAGKNGEQILAILDTISAEDDSTKYNEPTAEFIEF